MPKERINITSLKEVRCEHCVYWNRGSDPDISGVCREGKLTVTPSGTFLFPVTYLDCWCGRGGWFIQESDRIQSYESLIEKFNKPQESPPK